MFAGHHELLGATWAWTAETATHALRLVFGGVFDRYPKARLILGHMGETLPYLMWRLDSRWRVQAGNEPIERAPSDIIRDNIFVTTSGVCSHASLACALAALGEDRVMFSVDYPYEDCEVAAEFIGSAPISEEARAKVCNGTARRLLRL
jgi:2,3-dihydroxybenzoate decarboxylase